MTWLTTRLGVRAPLVSAPMAGVADGAFAAAVSAAGALGMVGVGSSADGNWVRDQCRVAGTRGQPYGVGLTAWAVDARPEQLEAVIECRPDLVSVSFGDYARHLPSLREAGIVVTTQVGTLAEARAAAAAGVDLVVARGREGGGHGRDEVGLLVLLQEVLEAVDLPVLAAGGIGTPRGVAAVLAAGAAGAWVGTAFLACPQATPGVPARRRLLDAADTDTVYGRVFDVAQGLGWPAQFGGRSLRNAFFTRWSQELEELAGSDDARAQLSAGRASGDYDVAYLYAGQGVGLLDRERNVAEVVAYLSARVE